MPNEESRVDNCEKWSWLCEDHVLYAKGAPWYRYIWRRKFDKFGRIGSTRHAVMSRWDGVAQFFGYTWPIWVITMGAVFGAVAFGYVVYYVVVGYARWLRLQHSQLRWEEEGLLDTAKDVEGYNEVPPTYEDAVKPSPSPPPPLPPRPDLIHVL